MDKTTKTASEQDRDLLIKCNPESAAGACFSKDTGNVSGRKDIFS